jgi:hypothetical protein
MKKQIKIVTQNVQGKQQFKESEKRACAIRRVTMKSNQHRQRLREANTRPLTNGLQKLTEESICHKKHCG